MYSNAHAAVCRSLAEALVDEAWYLSILGVRPAARGQGIAQRLIEATLKRADEVGVPCFLETFNPLSLPFYRRLGFERDAAWRGYETQGPRP
jgi:GNAT superfamily N-acetyltransferase